MSKMNDDHLPLPGHEAAYLTARLKLDHEESNTKVAERLRRIMSTCFDGSRSGDLAFQLADMEEWIPKFTSEWKANHRRWLELCTRLGLDGRVAEVDAVAGEALELKRIRHGDREGEPSWGVIADCVLAHVSQHRQAQKILDVPDHVTLDQAATVVRGVVDDAAATRLILEASLGRIPDPARSTVQLAREVVDQTERWRVDAEHYRSEASNATSRQVESSPGATALRHTLAAQLRAAAKTASAWEEAAIREWAPLAPDYHDGDGTVAAAVEGPYIEHRLVMAWRGKVQRMADNLGADDSSSGLPSTAGPSKMAPNSASGDTRMRTKA